MGAASWVVMGGDGVMGGSWIWGLEEGCSPCVHQCMRWGDPGLGFGGGRRVAAPVCINACGACSRAILGQDLGAEGRLQPLCMVMAAAETAQAGLWGLKKRCGPCAW